MKRVLDRLALLALVAFVFAGCVTTGSRPQGNGLTKTSGGVPIHDWLETDGYQRVVDALTENPDLRGRRFQIVRGTGDSVSVAHETDRLTEDIAQGLRARALGQRGFVIVPRRPPKLEPGFKLSELNCDLFQEHDAYLTVTISARRPESDLLARIQFNAFDAKENAWIGGFSVYNDRVGLTSQEMDDLKKPYADNSFKGTAVMPYTTNEIQQMALYLAQSLTCKYQPYYRGEEILVYPEYDDLSRRKAADIMDAVESNLNNLNEIAVTDDRNAADWLLKAKMNPDGPKQGSHSLWVELVRKDGRHVQGVSAHAFVVIDNSPAANFSGLWNILDTPGNRQWGKLHVFQQVPGRFAANVLGPDGDSLIASEVDVKIEGNKIHFTLVARVEDRPRTIDFQGVLTEGGARITARVEAFPPYEGFSKNKVLVKLDY